MSDKLNLVVSGARRKLPSQMLFKGWKPYQDMRMVRKNAFRLASEFKLAPGDCIVVTNLRWDEPSQRKFCLVVQTAEQIPLVCFLPTVKVSVLGNLSIKMHDFLEIYSRSQS